MGKTKKDKKKGMGAEKTAAKANKKLSKKEQKALAAKGEADIEAILAELAAEDKRKTEIIVKKCDPPSPRANLTMNAHTERDELFLFGGEFCTGSKTYLYNDLFLYNIRKHEWTQIMCPNSPPPRCSHQAVMLPLGGGQLWVFGGEFASPTQSQFYHYKDLWVYFVKEHRWQQISAKGGPSARSGHRMVAFRKLLIVFGGFHDNLRDCKYYNDVYAFNLETQVWSRIEPTGIAPKPRSACQFISQQEGGRIIIYGGYSKEKSKKDSEQGIVHSDMFALVMEDKKSADVAPMKWKWQQMKQSGDKPTPRSGMSIVQLTDNRAMTFGGVFDKEEDDDIESQFFNDSYFLELDCGKWHHVNYRSPKMEHSSRTESEPMDTEDKTEACADDIVVHDDGVFKVRIGPSLTAGAVADGALDQASGHTAFIPNPRMNCIMVHKRGVVYLYGGTYESGDVQVTLDDFYSLETRQLTEWKTLSQGTYDQQVWDESGSSSDSEDEEEDSDEVSDDGN